MDSNLSAASPVNTGMDAISNAIIVKNFVNSLQTQRYTEFRHTYKSLDIIGTKTATSSAERPPKGVS